MYMCTYRFISQSTSNVSSHWNRTNSRYCHTVVPPQHYDHRLSVVNVMMSVDETYADVMPVRMNNDSPSAYM